MWRSGLRENILSTYHDVYAREKLSNLHLTRSDIYKMLWAGVIVFQSIVLLIIHFPYSSHYQIL